jgi:hypothetical protein
VKTAAISTTSDITSFNLLFWKTIIASGVVLFLGFTVFNLPGYLEFITMYDQIFPDYQAVAAINQLPDLCQFNLQSVDLLHDKVPFWPKEKIELMVKFFVNKDVTEYQNVFIYVTNTRSDLRDITDFFN